MSQLVLFWAGLKVTLRWAGRAGGQCAGRDGDPIAARCLVHFHAVFPRRRVGAWHRLPRAFSDDGQHAASASAWKLSGGRRATIERRRPAGRHGPVCWVATRSLLVVVCCARPSSLISINQSSHRSCTITSIDSFHYTSTCRSRTNGLTLAIGDRISYTIICMYSEDLHCTSTVVFLTVARLSSPAHSELMLKTELFDIAYCERSDYSLHASSSFETYWDYWRYLK